MKHELKTLEDILNVITKENIDIFLVDFKGWLGINIFAQETRKELGDMVDVSLPNRGTMTWIDDNKNDVSLNIEISKEVKK